MVVDEKLQGIFDRLPFVPTQDQVDLCVACISGNNVLGIGKPGVGKTTIVEVLVEYFGDRLLIGSTTGISNQRMLDGKGGVGSMSRIFSLPRGIHTDKNSKKLSRFTTEVLSKNHKVDTVLIDEAGFMLNADSLALIKKRILRLNKKTRKRPKRDIKLILLGDVAQLPAFASPEETEYIKKTYGSFFFFKSHTFEEMNFKVITLDEVKRTDNKAFLACQDVIRYAQVDRYEKMLLWANKIMYKPHIPEGLPLMSCWVREAERANNIALSNINKKAFEYTAITSGNFNMNDCPVSDTFTVKEGALIMMVINDLENNEYSNGSIARVSSSVISTEGFYATMQHSGKEIFIERNLFEQTELKVVSEIEVEGGENKIITEEVVVGSCSMFPCVLAFGMSIHKSQGSTISSPCILDLGKYGFSNPDRFGNSLAYTGITRFTDPRNIYLKYPLKREHLHVNKEILEWLQSLNKQKGEQ